MFKLDKGQLRWLAMLTMVLDHFAEMFLKPGLEERSEILTNLHLSQPVAEALCSIFISLGTFTGTVMLYFLIEGYFYTKDLKKYMLRLLLFGAISQIPFYMAFRLPALNMLFTLAVCLSAIYVHYNVPDSGKKNLMIIGLFFINCFSDWTIMAVPITLFLCEAFVPVAENQRTLQNQQTVLIQHDMQNQQTVNGQAIKSAHGFKVNQDRLKISWIKSFVIMLIIHVVSLESFLKGASITIGFVLAAVLLTFVYDGGMSKTSDRPTNIDTFSYFKKYGFYVFYPLHLVVLSVIYNSLNNFLK
ncbi:MAG: conjugal transfer protein TraX [Oribacterium sp.]|nr:conjugal transfer protein TraX [Oribacterium sp.]